VYVCKESGTDLIASVPWEGTKEVDIVFHHSKILRSWHPHMKDRSKWKEDYETIMEEGLLIPSNPFELDHGAISKQNHFRLLSSAELINGD
jgi:hypothetical protein